jgi:predicted  nucleic acid-binding Zn-ribbon protein
MAAKTRLTSAQEKKLAEVRQHTIGDVMVGLAELHMMAGGPVEDLNEALEALIDDTEEKIADNDESYNERSLQNQSEVTRLEGQITDVEVQIASTTNLLESILYPTLESLQQNLADLNGEVEENNAYVARITQEREDTHEVYETNVAEQNDALSAIDECLEILNSLSGSDLSLIQTKKVQVNLKKIVSKLKTNSNNSFIKALVSIASQEFANTGALLRVIEAFENVKAGVIEALDLLHTNEAASVAHYEEEVAEREDDNRRLAREINIVLGEIDGTENRIFQKEAFLADRNEALSAFTAELEAEEAAFEEATQFYEDVRAELTRELSVANDAYGIIQNAGFGSNLSANIAF